MKLNLEKKVVLVTGGTRGIGKCIVEAFLAEGATVCFCSRTAAAVASVEQALTAAYPASQCHGAVVDVSDAAQLDAWVASSAAARGGVDVVVANPSTLSMADTRAAWAASFETDMMASRNLMQAAVPHLERTKGSIVSIATVSARDLDFTVPSPYGALKAALIHYTAQMARTLAPKGVRANTVSPGNVYFKGGVWEQIEHDKPEFFAGQLKANPMGRMVRPEEVADAVVFLASERASCVTGQNLNVDGGLCTGVNY
ncbi:NAD(P)-binding domain-containingprotein [Apiospora kogelbergensis]|uniref:NAD(P)-binding domain-containingprotein n=1 Tax=Apiospora kogelbergensis TaxID=1337665 RepID=UPI00313158DC